MPKKSATPSELANDIRTKKLQAMKERDRFKDADELQSLRRYNQELVIYCKKLEEILAVAEVQLIRMGTSPKAKPAFPSYKRPAPMPPHANGAPKKRRASPMPKQTVLPGELGKVGPQ